MTRGFRLILLCVSWLLLMGSSVSQNAVSDAKALKWIRLALESTKECIERPPIKIGAITSRNVGVSFTRLSFEIEAVGANGRTNIRSVSVTFSDLNAERVKRVQVGLSYSGKWRNCRVGMELHCKNSSKCIKVSDANGPATRLKSLTVLLNNAGTGADARHRAIRVVDTMIRYLVDTTSGR